MKALTSTLAIALILTACDGGPSSPTRPSVTSPPTSSSETDWSVTQSFVSVVGPDNCWVRNQRAALTGAIFSDIPMTVTRSGGSILLESDFFEVNYAGTLSGNEFSASGGPLPAGGRPCEDGTSFRQEPGVSNLTGGFSTDDQQLTASEVNSYRLTTGEPVTYTWDWQATRQD